MSATAVRAYWDNQTNFPIILPDFIEQKLWMSKKSSEISETIDVERCAYGADDRQWFEILTGHGQTSIVPVIVHGGYWRGLTAEEHRVMIPGLTSLGTHVANLEYRLLPAVRMEQAVSDVTLGLLEIVRQFRDHLLLPVGHSAGAHLATMAAATPELRDRLAGLVAVSGLFDLRPISQCFLQDELALSADEIDKFSPLHVPKDVSALYIYGRQETAEFERQSMLAAALSGAPIAAVDGAHHLNVIEPLSRPKSHLCDLIHDWRAGRPIPSVIKKDS